MRNSSVLWEGGISISPCTCKLKGLREGETVTRGPSFKEETLGGEPSVEESGLLPEDGFVQHGGKEEDAFI